MLDFALQKYPVRYPLETSVQCMIRPMEATDEPHFREFLHAVPEEERLFIKRRLDDPAMVKDIFDDLDYDSRLPLLAFADGKVIGLAVLEQRMGGWKRHIGMVRLLTHPGYRGVGLAEMLIKEIVEVGSHCGLSHLQTEMNGERELAIRAFKSEGFVEHLRLRDYVMDMQAKTHVYVLMGMSLAVSAENAGAGD